MSLKLDNIKSTCILLFGQSEIKESTIKPIAVDGKKNVLLWKKMNNKIVTTIQKTGIHYFHSNETNQKGTNFGEKLSNAIQLVFDKGYEKVIVVGNDCPQLTSKILTETALKIQENDFVLGPDYNGGLYLIGVSKNTFSYNEFSKLNWKSTDLFKNIVSTFATTSIIILKQLNDFNTANNLKEILFKFSHNNFFRAIVLSFLKQLTPINSVKFLNLRQIYSHFIFNKGSPNYYFLSN